MAQSSSLDCCSWFFISPFRYFGCFYVSSTVKLQPGALGKDKIPTAAHPLHAYESFATSPLPLPIVTSMQSTITAFNPPPDG